MAAPLKFLEIQRDPKNPESVKRYPLRISYLALVEFKKETGKNFDESMSKDGDLELIAPLLWAALKSGSKSTGIELDIKRDEIDSILDDHLFDFLTLIPQFFPSPESLGNPIPKAK